MLPLAFFIIALLYSTVGFGGGSSYLALLAVSGVAYPLIPKLGLVCNLLVVSGGCWHFWRSGHVNKRLVIPFILGSVPFAFLGGLYPVTEKIFLSLLAISLFIAGIRLLLIPKSNYKVTTPSPVLSIIMGGGLGILSGLVGIGGGIFLSPILLNLKWGTPKEVAATASIFIWVNSISGLLGQSIKSWNLDLFDYWPLFLAVIIGGQIGSRIGVHQKVSHSLIQKGTALLVLIVAGRLLLKLLA